MDWQTTHAHTHARALVYRTPAVYAIAAAAVIIAFSYIICQAKTVIVTDTKNYISSFFCDLYLILNCIQEMKRDELNYTKETQITTGTIAITYRGTLYLGI